jgi:glycosyltransferase involved in cell wall biosynthesis
LKDNSDIARLKGVTEKELRRYRKSILKAFSDKWFYAYAYDAHVCYIQKAYEIYGSFGVTKESIFLTYNSPDTDLLMSINEKVKNEQPILPENPYRLLHVGRLVDWKRVDLIIEAVNLLKEKNPRIKLIVVGYGPKEDDWKKCALDLGVQDKVKFVGGVYELGVLGKYFRASSIYVLGGMGGLSINDAMSFERPIICSVCDGTEAHLVRDGFNGMYFENGNSTDLANKIEKMWSSPEKLKQMGENSYSIIKNEININKVIDGYTGAFKYVLNR